MFNMFIVFVILVLAYRTANIGASAPITKEIFVNPGPGSGNFTTIQDAIDHGVPNHNKGWVLIHVAPGVYTESVTIPRHKPYVYLKGRSRSITTVAWRTSGGTLLESTLMVEADNFIAQRITFKNTFNSDTPGAGEVIKSAVAVKVRGDKNSFYQCGIIGYQDTLHDEVGRHFFRSCYIQGAIDFIFGSGTSTYQGCAIKASGYGFVTAQGRSRPDDKSGFIFKYCRVYGRGPTSLGRAYRPYSRVLFYKSWFSDIVTPWGWDAWGFVGHENRITFAEIGCRGSGADTTKRVSWVKTLTKSELKSLISTSFIDDEGWIAYQPVIN